MQIRQLGLEPKWVRSSVGDGRILGQKELELVIPDPPRQGTLQVRFPERDQSEANEAAN